jgi:hypothetical protein
MPYGAPRAKPLWGSSVRPSREVSAAGSCAMDKTEFYLSKAKEARRNADSATRTIDKARWLEIADSYEKLARDAMRTPDTPSGKPDG